MRLLIACEGISFFRLKFLVSLSEKNRLRKRADFFSARFRRRFYFSPRVKLETWAEKTECSRGLQIADSLSRISWILKLRKQKFFRFQSPDSLSWGDIDQLLGSLRESVFEWRTSSESEWTLCFIRQWFCPNQVNGLYKRKLKQTFRNTRLAVQVQLHCSYM